MSSNLFNKHRNKIIISIFLVLVICLVIYYLNIDWGHSVLYDSYDYYYGNKNKMVGYEKIKDSTEGIQYSYSLFLRTDNIPANAHWDENADNLKVIIEHEGTPTILYSRKDNTLFIQINYKNKNNVLTPYNIVFENVESQMWLHFVIVVDNQNVCVYKNKVLEKCVKLPGIPWRSNKMFYIGYPKDNFNGYVGYIDYFNYPIKPDKVYKYYKKHMSKLPNKLLSYEQYEYLKKDSSNLNLFNKT